MTHDVPVMKLNQRHGLRLEALRAKITADMVPVWVNGLGFLLTPNRS